MKILNEKIISLVSGAKSKAMWTDVSLITLIAANAVPLFGVVFLKWDVFYILFLYCAENLAIGFYNVLKMVFVKVRNPVEHLGKLFIIPFFMVHYGLFTTVHGVSFVYNYLIKGEYARTNTGNLMGQPYGRVIVMHITVLIGGILFKVTGSPVALLIILIGLKTFIDISLHNAEHKKVSLAK